MRDGLPCWRWRVGEVVLERRARHAPRSRRRSRWCTRLVAGGPVRAHRRAAVHLARRARRAAGRGDGPLRVDKTADGVVIEDAYRIAGPGFEPDGEWYGGAHHREEAARGLAAEEDLFRVGRFTPTAARRPARASRVGAWDRRASPCHRRRPARSSPPPRHRAAAITRSRGERRGGADLAADAFIVRTAAGPDVVAGYPWFGAWSRDTMIAYEGLFLSTGPGRRGARAAARVRRHAVRGHARQHGRHRPDRVQHRRRHPVVPARGGPARRRDRGHRPRRRAGRAARRRGTRGTARAPGTASGSTPTDCSPRAPTDTR